MKYSKIILTIALLTLWVSGLRAEEIFLQQCKDFLTSENNAALVQPFALKSECAEEATSTRWLALSKCTVKEKEQNHSLALLISNFFRSSELVELDSLLKEGEKALKEADYSTALKIFKRGLHKAQTQGKKNYVGGFFNDIAAVQNAKGEYQKARTNYNRALKINSTGPSLTGIGAVYDNIGQYKKALNSHKQALDFYRKNKDKRGEGGTLMNIGLVHLKRGEYQQALAHLQHALEIQCDIKETYEVGRNLSHIGVVYRNLGQYQENQGALEYLQKALAIRCKIADRSGIGETLTNIGNVYGNRGEYQKALDYYKKALAISCDIGKKRSISIGFNNLGDAYNNLYQYQKALKYFKYASDIDRQIDNKQGEAIDLISLGEVYKNLEQYNDTKVQFEKSVAILKDLGSGYLWKAQSGLAFAENKLNQFDAAIQHYQQALDNIEKLRADITAKQYKTSFMRDKLYVYDEFIALLQFLHSNHPKKGYDHKALEMFERKQGRVFLEEMGKSGAWKFSGVSKEISQKDRELELQIEVARKNNTKSFTQGKDTEAHRKRLEKLQAEQADFEKTLQTDYPAYYALKYPKPISLETLQKDVLQAGEFMFIYNVRKEATDLWVIDKQQFQMLTLNISEEELQTKVDAFRANPNTLIEAIKTEPPWAISDLAEDNLPSLRQASYDLYWLLMPEKAKTLLKYASTLYIVPTGPLYGLPFGALDTHNPAQHDTPHYLIQNYPIAYLSSASLLKTIRDTKRNETSNRYPFLAFAEPEYPKTCSSKTADATQVIQTLRTETYLKLASSGDDTCFTKSQELPETKVQAETIAKLLNAPKDSNALQLREKASRSNVFDFSDKKRLDDYQYVLFAAHAVLPNEISYIKQSAIVLSNPDTEGYLTMADAFALDMNADLVMLSACNTGRGKKSKGEGIRGLTRAFMYAGTPAVSVSLWSVESRSTKALSISLFKYLQAGKPLAQALRQSKLDLMADEDFEMYQHPYFWAPFVVFGDGN
jgi:CHAT domain-containing protein/Flp pilus assembly protein TadD